MRARRAGHAAARGLLPAARERHLARSARRSRPASAGRARSTRTSPASTSSVARRRRARRSGSSPSSWRIRASPRRAWRSPRAARSTSGTLSPMLDVGDRPRVRPGRARRGRHRDHHRPARAAAPRAYRQEAVLQARGVVVAAEESYPDDLRYHRRARLGAHRRRHRDARDHLVRAGRPRGDRPLRAARGGLVGREGRELRRGRVGEGGLRARSSPLSGEVVEVNAKVVDEPETINDDPVRRGLARAHPAVRPGRGRTTCSTSAPTARSLAEQ